MGSCVLQKNPKKELCKRLLCVDLSWALYLIASQAWLAGRVIIEDLQLYLLIFCKIICETSTTVKYADFAKVPFSCHISEAYAVLTQFSVSTFIQTSQFSRRSFWRFYFHEGRDLEFYFKPFDCEAKLEWVCQITKGKLQLYPFIHRKEFITCYH